MKKILENGIIGLLFPKFATDFISKESEINMLNQKIKVLVRLNNQKDQSNEFWKKCFRNEAFKNVLNSESNDKLKMHLKHLSKLLFQEKEKVNFLNNRIVELERINKILKNSSMFWENKEFETYLKLNHIQLILDSKLSNHEKLEEINHTTKIKKPLEDDFPKYESKEESK